ncbi:MAG: STAS domain-containing protein [Methylococcaceae bacterium]|jgi:anti-anti-sigma factor|nr:STAS domain-containing protein [Methylococcaceae bacterium]
MAKKTRSEPHRVAVEGEVTIYRAAELKQHLLGELAAHPELEFDLSLVQEIDGSGLQLLILLKQEAARLKRSVKFCGHSQAVLDVLDLCDLGGYFGDPVVIPSPNSAR